MTEPTPILLALARGKRWLRTPESVKPVLCGRLPKRNASILIVAKHWTSWQPRLRKTIWDIKEAKLYV